MNTKHPSFISKWACIVLLVFFSAALVKASPILLTAGTGSEALDYWGSVGFSFKLSSNEVVSSLGIYDAANPGLSGYQGDGLLQAHTVDLYNSSVTLLADATFSAGAAGANGAGFIYATPTIIAGSTLVLAAGSTYVISTTYLNTETGDNYKDDTLASAPLIAPGVTLISGLFGGANVEPVNGHNLAIVGPNLTVVPEPGSWVLLSLGLGLLLLRFRHRNLV